MRDRGDGNYTGAEGTSSHIEARNLIAKKQKKTPSIVAVAADGVADTDGKATPSKLAMMKQIETPAKEAINVDCNDVVKAASAKAIALPTPHRLSKKKQKKTSAKE